MPICTNPKCGEISKSKTRFCPHCGQESLSTVSKQELGNIQDEPLTTETFENETLYSPAPQDRVSSRKRIFHSSPSGVKFRMKLNVKKILAIMIFVPIAAILIFDAAPASWKDSIYLKLDRQQEFSTDFNEDELQFKFMAYSENGIPVYFKGCGPIDYFIRQNYASSQDISIVKTALSNLADGAGRSFNFKGLSENTEGVAPPGSVLIDFTNERESKELRKAQSKAQSDSESGVAGLGGPGIPIFTNTPRFNSQVSTDGTISINQRYWPGLSTEDKITVIMHEMGHVLGLDHPVNGTNQLMDASGSYYNTSLGKGDLLGLQILSALGGCREFPDYLTQASSQESSSPTNSDDVQIIKPVEEADLLTRLNSETKVSWEDGRLTSSADEVYSGPILQRITSSFEWQREHSADGLTCNTEIYVYENLSTAQRDASSLQESFLKVWVLKDPVTQQGIAVAEVKPYSWDVGPGNICTQDLAKFFKVKLSN